MVFGKTRFFYISKIPITQFLLERFTLIATKKVSEEMGGTETWMSNIEQ